MNIIIFALQIIWRTYVPPEKVTDMYILIWNPTKTKANTAVQPPTLSIKRLKYIY